MSEPLNLSVVIDPRLLRESPDDLRESQRRRGEDVALVDRLVELDVARRAAQTGYDEFAPPSKKQLFQAASVRSRVR